MKKEEIKKLRDIIENHVMDSCSIIEGMKKGTHLQSGVLIDAHCDRIFFGLAALDSLNNIEEAENIRDLNKVAKDLFRCDDIEDGSASEKMHYPWD